VRQEKCADAELVSSFKVRKKIILRRAGQEMFRLHAPRSKKKRCPGLPLACSGELPVHYRLFLNPLIFSEDGSDDYLCAEHYYMFGNSKRSRPFHDFPPVGTEFSAGIGIREAVDDEHW